MSLIKSISGIRGTIGGLAGEGLSPLDIVKFTAAFASLLQKSKINKKLKLVVGRDARISGIMVDHLVVGTLLGMGIDVIETGLSTTPTVEMAVIDKKADGGIILTASHNPMQWNALKLLNDQGEFIDANEGEKVLHLAESLNLKFAPVDKLGKYETDFETINRHIDNILALPLVDVEIIKKAHFRVAVDAVNSTGGIAIPQLLRKLGVVEIVEINCNPTGIFAHNPEPLPEHLHEIAHVVTDKKCDLGIVVDPDVDRLAFICEDGSMFGEEYTLVSIADYILADKKGNTVSNMSSTRALRDVTETYGGNYQASAVGEVNVVNKMKETNAIIGGEGNGGIIYPELHYGRDALVGVALFLTYLAKKGISASSLRKSYPNYVISKNKIELTPDIDIDEVLQCIAEKYKDYPVNTVDGVKIEFDNEWVHLRKSNTEPIVRIYSESKTKAKADMLAHKVIEDIKSYK